MRRSLFHCPFSRPAKLFARPRLEQLDDRSVPAVIAVYNDGLLSVQGDASDNAIVVSADAAGQLLVTNNGKSVPIQVLLGQATRDQVAHVTIEGRGGNDSLSTDVSLNTIVNGALAKAPTASLYGGGGNDTLRVGHGGIVGGLAGVVNGVVVGPVVGNSVMEGGAGHDALISGFGNDIMRGGDGNDSYLWPPGTLTDIWDGGAGNDTATIIGNDSFLGAPAGDAFKLSANGERVLFQRTNLVQFAVDMGSTENIVLRPGAGDDSVTILDLNCTKSLRQVVVDGGDGHDMIDGSAQALASVALIFDGGAGDDVLKGGAGADVLQGGAGNDVLNGGRGKDVLNGGDGDDKLHGGADAAADVLSGGPGADLFFKRSADVVVDFNAGEGDWIQVI